MKSSQVKDYYKLAQKIIKKHVNYKRAEHEDRNVLESIIFPYILARFDPQASLDIGRENYQIFYNEYFVGRELWTLDIDPDKKKYGADNHIIDCASNLGKHFNNNYLDFILMNGVFGWGLDEEEEVQKAFNAIYDILKPGGIFVLGWNDDFVPLGKIEGLKKFKPYYFKPLKGTEFKCVNGEHKYNFYIKE